MPLPLSIVLKAADTLRSEAVRNRRRRPETRVKMFQAAQTMLPRYIGRLLLEEALREHKEGEA